MLTRSRRFVVLELHHHRAAMELRAREEALPAHARRRHASGLVDCAAVARRHLVALEREREVAAARVLGHDLPAPNVRVEERSQTQAA
eukprot:571767-Rhodomonas_salina.1